MSMAAALFLSAFSAFGQYEYKFLFKGLAYETNSSGNIVATPITEQALLQDRATAGGVTDLSTIALVYHVGGDEKGDTVEIVSSTNGQRLAFEFGFWFGSDPSLQRSALTNATQTEQRRVDYIYTLETATYICLNTHSSGAAFVTKRTLTDNSGNVNVTVEGTMQWMVNPQNGHGTIVINGSFSTGQRLF
jgi:hypothetical protein